jgi:hypothetical protein
MPTVQEVWQDPDFHKLPPPEKAKVMQSLDSDFASLPTSEQNKVVFQLSNRHIKPQTDVEQQQSFDAANDKAARGESVFGGNKPADTRKISYTDSGYRPNKPETGLKGLAKNFVQDAVELPLMPVRMAADVLNSPDTGRSLKDLAVGVVRGPLEFIPGVGEALGGRSATEAWQTNPGLGALTVAGGTMGAKAIKGKVAEARSIPNAAKLNTTLDQSFTKAVRPSVENTRTAQQASNYTSSARNAVKEIVLNKDNLGLMDVDGNPVSGLPKNLDQFRQSIDSTKRQLWRQVEEVNAAAGQAGVEVPLQSAVTELQSLSTNPVYSTMEPGTVTYATQKANALAKQKSFTVDQAQDAVTLANQSLKNFYRNPSADTASRAYVDSLIANHLRSNLDGAIELATGSEAAGPLRKAYGSLKAIEKDVNQRATVDARKNSRGLIDFADIYTAGELVSALASFNPVGMAKAGTMAAVKGYIKKLNDPNTHVRRVFGAAEKLVSAPKNKFTPPTGRTVPKEPPPQPPWAGKVNTGGITQPVNGPLRNDMAVNQGGLRQPGPVINQMGPVNVGGITQPSRPTSQTSQMQRSNPSDPAYTQVSPNLLSSAKPATSSKATTWTQYLAENMGTAMKSEGSHGAAIRKLAGEWKTLKKK